MNGTSQRPPAGVWFSGIMMIYAAHHGRSPDDIGPLANGVLSDLLTCGRGGVDTVTQSQTNGV